MKINQRPFYEIWVMVVLVLVVLSVGCNTPDAPTTQRMVEPLSPLTSEGRCSFHTLNPPQIRPTQLCGGQVSSLFEAIERNCPDGVVQFLDRDPTLLERPSPGVYSGMLHITPLILAIVRGDLEITQLLLKRGASLNTRTDAECEADRWVTCYAPDRLPIHFAVRSGLQPMVEALISNGADINSEGGNERYEVTAYCDARLTDFDMRRFLIDHGADTSQCDVLKQAMKSGDYCQAEFAISYAHAHPSADHLQALISGSDEEHLDVVALLLDSGLDPNERNTNEKDLRWDNLLSYAIREKKRGVLELLLDRGASITSGNQRFILQDDKLDFETFIYLLGRGASYDEPDGFGRLPLQKLPGTKDALKIATYLVDKLGADVNAAYMGSSPPIVALFGASYRPEVLEFLHDRGANVNGRGAHGTHALQEALISLWPYEEHEKYQLIQKLLSWGADPRLLNEDNEGPMNFARSVRIAELLRKAGAKVANYTKDGRSLLENAYGCREYERMESFDLELFRYALQNGVDPKRTVEFKARGKTPAWFVFVDQCGTTIDGGDRVIQGLELLARAGVNFNQKPADGACVVDSVTGSDVRRWLKSHGVKCGQFPSSP